MTQQVLTKRVKLRAAALELFRSRDPQVLICGAAGTGKSFAALQKMHMMCLVNPGMKALIVRQTMVSLTATGVDTYKKHVAKEALENGLVTFFGGSLQEPPQFRYANGSKIMLGGMDNPTKIMSSEYDLIFVQEATELSVTAWEKLDTRLRNGHVSFQQLMADCNPDRPDHWLKVRCDEGRTRMLLARHTDNPVLFDDAGRPTDKGEAYLARLANLTGVRKLRLEKGIWAAAEGVIFDEYDPAVHISNRKRLPREWARVWGVDFGHTNPFVWQQWARDPDGRLWLEHEIYRTKRLVKDHAHQILQVVTNSEGKWRYPKPEAIVCDHDAEDRATLERELGLPTIAAKKDVKPGIEATQLRFRLAGDGMPRLHLLAGALVDRDEEVAAAGLPLGLYGELPGYVWKPGLDGKPVPDEPLKQNDHSCDTMRYVVAYHDLRARVRARWL